ncbi:MAG: hypothetical protein ACP5HC_09680, partial [Caldisericum sp.]
PIQEGQRRREKEIKTETNKNYLATEYAHFFLDNLVSEISDYGGFYDFIKEDFSASYPDLEDINENEARYLDENLEFLPEDYQELARIYSLYDKLPPLHHSVNKHSNFYENAKRDADEFLYNKIIDTLTKGYESGELSTDSELHNSRFYNVHPKGGI